jgi:hypothetical protein
LVNKRLVERAVRHQRLRERDTRGVMVSGARCYQQVGLLGEGIGDDPRRMAEAIDRPALDEIKIALAGVVPQPRALAALEHDRRPRGEFH